MKEVMFDMKQYGEQEVPVLVEPEKAPAFEDERLDLTVPCPMHACLVSVSNVCFSCPYFDDLSVNGVKQACDRAADGVITPDRYEMEVVEAVQNPRNYVVLCGFPNVLSCGPYYRGEDEEVKQ